MTTTVIASLSHEWWWAMRACRLADSALFLRPEAAGDVISIYCQRCPVRLECLGRALDHPHQTGVLGGLTQEQRARLISVINSTREGT